jgi:2-polyprenyl-6-methoxyphenol hydroxylase-like FAD-dependent oxidoreductase
MASRVSVTCCVAGGGPAGMMAGVLLARAGVDVLVLEKHADFLRDFRGDTIHPSTLEVLHELGWLDAFLALPHQTVRELTGQVGDTTVTIADFGHLPTRCRFVAFMPQWDFLNFLAQRGAEYSTFDVRMQTEVEGLLEESGRVVGVRARASGEPLEVRAQLVIGADGRDSIVRADAGLPVTDLGAPMDVFWFRLSRRPDEVTPALGRVEPGRIFVALNRGKHWQCGYVIPKGHAEQIRARGLEAFRADIARLLPVARDRVGELADWDAVKLLTVRVDRLDRWSRPGLLCIGDAAHAMSPVGGVGINLAIQDAVAAANLLAAPLRDGRLTLADLRQVQRRREWPTRAMQALQIAIQKRVIRRVLGAAGPLRPPLLVRLLDEVPYLRRIPGRLVGLGFRPEHVSIGELAQADARVARQSAARADLRRAAGNAGSVGSHGL